MATGLTIGRVADATGIAATTLRYYEQIGLVPAPVRVGGQRRYDDSVLARLEVIGLCKSAGFTLDGTDPSPVAQAIVNGLAMTD